MDIIVEINPLFNPSGKPTFTIKENKWAVVPSPFQEDNCMALPASIETKDDNVEVSTRPDFSSLDCLFSHYAYC